MSNCNNPAQITHVCPRTNMAYQFVIWTILTFLCRVQAQGGIQIEYDFTEEQPVHSVVGDLSTDSGLDEIYSPAEMSQLMYSAQQGRHMDKFRLHSSGLLTTARRIDRDSMCPSNPTCKIELNVVVQPNAFFQIIKVVIYIIDVNDNQPIFPQSSIIMPITESAAINSRYVIPSPLDADSGIHTVQTYQLRPAGSKFDLTVEENEEDGSVDIHLQLVRELDREEESEYDLQVIAVDGGTPGLSGTIRIHVNVVDSNDNNPVFHNSTYISTVPENLPVDSVILQVYATDRDEGLNGDIMYSFTDLAREQFGDQFRIDIVTGEVILTHELDYETTQTYLLDIIARDKGPNSLPDYTRVHINVLDINDHAPEVVVNALTDSGIAEVQEGASIGRFVAHIQVVDLDSGVAGEVSCWMNDEYFSMEELYPSAFKVETRAIFDRELQDTYYTDIVCEDGGNPTMSTVQQLTVHIGDINDQTPAFTHAPLVVELPENNVIDAFIARVNATDGDIGSNAEITYAVASDAVSSDPELLTVHPVTGIITASTVFDYEIRRDYTFAITATDKGSPHPRTATTTLSIRVIDLNDEMPVFSNTTYNMHVPENAPANTVVGVVTATDSDVTTQFAEIVYILDQEENGDGMFLVHPVTGTIVLKEPMDREMKSTYYLIIVASNPSYPLMRSIAHVTVHIADTNDNKPIFLFPSSRNSSISVSDLAQVGEDVAQVRTIDSDEGINGHVVYEIISNETIATFHINAETGAISVARKLNNLDYTFVELTVFALDQGVPQNVVSEQLLIHIDDSMARAARENVNPWWKDIKLIIICSLVPVLLIIVIITAMCVYHRRQSRSDKEHRYNCRIAEQEKMAGVPDGVKGTLPPSIGDKQPGIQVAGLDGGETSTDELYYTKAMQKNPTGTSLMEQTNNRSSRSLATISPNHHHPAKSVKFEPPPYDAVSPETCDVENDDNSLTDSGRGASEEGEIPSRVSPIEGKLHYNEVSYNTEPYRQHQAQQSHVVPLGRNGPQPKPARATNKYPPSGHSYINNMPYNVDTHQQHRVPPHPHNVRRSNYNSAGESDSSLNSSPPHVYNQKYPQPNHQQTNSNTSLQNGRTYRYPGDHNQNSNGTSCYYPIKLYKTNSNASDRPHPTASAGHHGEPVTVQHSVNAVVGQYIVPADGKRSQKRGGYDERHLGIADNISDGGTTTSGSYTVDDVDSVVSVDRSNDSVCV